MTKDLFIEAIEAIRLQHLRGIEVMEASAVIYPNAFEANLLPVKNLSEEILIKILETELNDDGKWIQYYIYELDFGDKGKKQASYKNGRRIPLACAEELYDFLTKNKNLN